MSQGPLLANVANQKQAAGTFAAPMRLDAQNALQVGQQHGDYYGAAIATRVFKAANQSGATLSAGLATTYVGLCLSNPAASGKNLSVQRVSGQIIVAPAAVLALGLIAGFVAGGVTVHTTPVTPLSSALGSGIVPVAKVDAACTLVGTPAWLDWFAVNAVSANLIGFTTDLRGSIIIPPGGYIAIGANVAGPTAGLVGSFEWEEAVLPL